MPLCVIRDDLVDDGRVAGGCPLESRCRRRVAVRPLEDRPMLQATFPPRHDAESTSDPRAHAAGAGRHACGGSRFRPSTSCRAGRRGNGPVAAAL